MGQEEISKRKVITKYHYYFTFNSEQKLFRISICYRSWGFRKSMASDIKKEP